MHYRSRAVFAMLCVLAVCALPIAATEDFRIGVITARSNRHEIRDFNRLLKENLASITLSDSMLEAYRARLDALSHIEYVKDQHRLIMKKGGD